ncbi:propionyl-CoA synthetase [Cupriavidus basilensis OR16]|uniref:Propionyl-CoA synthetase n=1 Tax=Cupriavidus basilensis OR16 TaxID=1127483 RepID=H1S2P7_9BURK|nr:propionyl-CoA synthetase [Cupriavidus basilensis OR16]
MTATRALHARSLSDPKGFWAEQARRIDWETPFETVLDDSRPPFTRWFVGGRTNLCHNAVDRHLAERADQAALIYVSTETGQRRTYSYAELHDEVNRMAAILQALGPARADDARAWPRRRLRCLARARGRGARAVRVARIERAVLRALHLRHHRTTGKPKGVQRDTGGYAVALAASMEYIFCGKAGDTMFSSSDIGWVVGHSYIVYGPLLAGMATVMYEGTPVRPDGGILWQLVEQYRVNIMFSAPTAIRVLKKQDPAWLTRYDLSSLRLLFLAGEPLDEPTASWIQQGIGKPVVDNYWQTETGWPIIAIQRGLDPLPAKLGSPGVPVYGYDLKIVDEATGAECPPGQKGVVAIDGPLPPGCMTTVWGDDERFVKTYWSGVPGRRCYSTFDWGVQDEDGYIFILGRTDDVINVAGHRLGTREIEESISSHPAVAEVAVVGVHDALKGQVAMAFVIVRDAGRIATQADRLALEGNVMKTVDQQLGAVARPARVFFVNALPKTRSGKLLRRAMQAVAEGRDPGDLTTIEDPTALAQLQEAMQG